MARSLPILRAVAALGAAAALAAMLVAFQAHDDPTNGWRLLGLAMALAAVAQLGVTYPAPPPGPPPLASGWRRRSAGLVVVALGAATWSYGVHRLLAHWTSGFDVAWLCWPAGAALMAAGADLAWGRWPSSPRRHGRWRVALAVAVLMAVAAVYRLGNIADFPGEAAASQVEDFQVGNFGNAFLNGERIRWEYLSSTWLAALGIALGGHSQLAVRIPFAVVSVLKLAPLFVWTRLLAGTGGALVMLGLLAPSIWDVILSRIPNNHNALVVAVAFCLLAGPVRRGRPSGYIGLGLIGGYILYEYVAYRPLVVWALAGATWYSLADRTVVWPLRLLRPLLTLALIASMVAPLFLTRLHGPLRSEYSDGWSRARGQVGYYNPEDTWARAAERRLARARETAELFVWRGDRSPVRNLNLWPLVDPVTAALLIAGLAGAAVHALRPLAALTLVGFVVHVVGTLVATGNFDVARVGGAVAYAYPLVGLGAAGLVAALGAAGGRRARALAWAALAAAVVWAAWWNTTHLQALWASPEVRRAHRSDLAYVTLWVRDHVRAGERVIGIAPQAPNAITTHDGIWLMPRKPPGRIVSDVESALRDWLTHPQPTLLFVAAGRTTEDIASYLQWLFPSLHFTLHRDPLQMDGDIAFVHAPARPPELAARLAALACRGAEAEFALLGGAREPVLAAQRTVAPFIDRATWPDDLMQRALPLGAQRLTVRYRADFELETGGEYRFSLATYSGHAILRIDGVRRDGHAYMPALLGPGRHTLEVDGEFSLITPSLQLRWSGPDTDNRQQLMPLYRLAVPRPGCGEVTSDE